MDHFSNPVMSRLIFFLLLFAEFAYRKIDRFLIIHTWPTLVILLHIIIYSLEFFTSALADGLSLESEWQQVSSSLQDSS